jgi:hypothetical protein
MEATGSSESLVTFYYTTRYHISETAIFLYIFPEIVDCTHTRVVLHASTNRWDLVHFVVTVSFIGAIVFLAVK